MTLFIFPFSVFLRKKTIHVCITSFRGAYARKCIFKEKKTHIVSSELFCPITYKINKEIGQYNYGVITYFQAESLKKNKENYCKTIKNIVQKKREIKMIYNSILYFSIG